MELIKLEKQEVQGEAKSTVSAKGLHAFLEVKRVWTSWILNRIKKYNFQKDIDYLVVYTKTGVNPMGGRPEAEYYITLDMAKELCMIEKNEKGREARKYFIECEIKVNDGPVTSTEALYAAVGRMVENERKLKLVQVENESDSFTSLQVTRIDELIHEQFRKHGDGKIAGFIKRDIKSKYFEITSTRTYKEIPRKHFNEVCEFIQNWKKS